MEVLHLGRVVMTCGMGLTKHLELDLPAGPADVATLVPAEETPAMEDPSLHTVVGTRAIQLNDQISDEKTDRLLSESTVPTAPAPLILVPSVSMPRLNIYLV